MSELELAEFEPDGGVSLFASSVPGFIDGGCFSI